MKASRLIIVIALLAMFASCLRQGDPVIPIESKDDFKITYLFEVDGIKVYRFYDGGRFIYFTNKVGNIEYTNINGRQSYKVQTICN